jgi:phospholipid/cholesterol/gamma-HCH transport system substrate-binding protein
VSEPWSSGRPQRAFEVKVGVFVLLSLAGALLVIFLLGGKRHIFEERVRLDAVFTDVGGLVEGAPVQLAGVGVGVVGRIDFDRTTPRPRIRVELEITRSALDLVRRDSMARIGALGLLGDKIVDVTVGSRDQPELQPGDTLQTVPPADFNKLLVEVGEILERARRAADDAARVLDALADPKTIGHVRGALASVHALLGAAERGPGLAHALFYDRRTAEALGELIERLARLAAHVDGGVARLDRLLAATDHDGDQLINNLSRAARSVGDTAGALGSARIMGNLEHVSGDLAQLTAQLRSGRGTLGALVVDPTVYEQLVTILGGVARSRILRALVRYAISRDDARTAARVVDEPPGRSRPLTSR